MNRAVRLAALLAATTIVVAAIYTVGTIAFGYYRVASSHSLFAEETKVYRRLADQRPPNATRAEWEHVIGCTLNLHGWCDYQSKQFPHPGYAAFVSELRDRTGNGPVSLEMIDWIWDSYFVLNPSSRTYVNQHRPTTAEARRKASEGEFGIAVK